MPLKVDDRDLRRLAKRVESIRKGGPLAAKRALRDTRRRTAAAITKTQEPGIRAEYTVKARALRKQIKVSQVTADLAFTGVASDKRLSLFEFAKPRQTRKGVTTQIVRRRKRHVIPSAFILKGKQVARREKSSDTKSGFVKRLPIKVFRGPSAAQMMKRNDRVARLRTFVSNRLRADLTKQYRRLIRG